MNHSNNKRRRRGVRASRVRLTRALTGAGLRTQVALAERIADLEDLDSPPRDAVSRAFRELPVELTTLERIARALDVEVHSLYLTSDERAPDSGMPPPRRLDRGTYILAGLVVAALAVTWMVDKLLPSTPESLTGESGLPVLDLGSSTLIVQPLANDDDGVLGDALRAQLGEYFSVATGTAAVLTADLPADDAADKLRSDAVLDGEIVTVGRLSGVRLYLYARGQRQQVWAESLPTAALADRAEAIARHASEAVRRATGMPVADNAPRHFPLAPVQDDYLEGEFHLDQPSSELNIKRAQSRFEAALRADANYARAHAGLCQSLLEEHWMASEERALQDAARACGQALQLNADDPVVVAAHAHFLRRTGRNDEALALYASLVIRVPKDSAAYFGYANSLLAAWRESGNAGDLEQAKAMAARAAAVDAVVWKPLFALATMHWFEGNVTAAIRTSEAARARDENEYVLANLGSFYLCDGAFEQAREAYQAAQQFAPQSYVGDEFLGMAHYFLGNFEESAALRRRAIGKVATGEPEIHEMWGNLGDAERMAGNGAAAEEAYRMAAEIAERDHLRGTQPVADRAARAWYYTALASLDPASVPVAVTRRIDDELDTIAAELAEASAHRRMAQTYLLRNETAKARNAVDNATTVCRGYGRMPDFADL